jgi:hypothetical protein
LREFLLGSRQVRWKGPTRLIRQLQQKRMNGGEQTAHFFGGYVREIVVFAVMLPASARRIGPHEPQRRHSCAVEREMVREGRDLRNDIHVESGMYEAAAGVLRELVGAGN